MFTTYDFINACSSGKPKIVQTILENHSNIDINAHYFKDNSALHFASLNGHLEIVKLLIKYGANIDIRNNNLETPMTCSCINQHVEIFNYLFQHGANIHLKNKQGNTPLHLSCLENCFTIIQSLTNVEIDINKRNNFGRTPLHLACTYGDINIINLLLDKGADITLDDNLGHNCIYVASKNFHHEIVDYLNTYQEYKNLSLTINDKNLSNNNLSVSSKKIKI